METVETKFPENLSKRSLPEMETSLTYVKFIGRRASIAEAVAERKKAEAMQLEFENTRIELIDECIKSGNLGHIFYLIFSPINVKDLFDRKSVVSIADNSVVNEQSSSATSSATKLLRTFGPKVLNPLGSGSLTLNYHIITDSINLDSGIWKLVADGKWETLKKLHRPTLDEFCPAKFKDKLALFWEII